MLGMGIIVYTGWTTMGGDLRGTGGDGPPKFEVGYGPGIRPPIFGEVVLRDAREKYKVINKK